LGRSIRLADVPATKKSTPAAATAPTTTHDCPGDMTATVVRPCDRRRAPAVPPPLHPLPTLRGSLLPVLTRTTGASSRKACRRLYVMAASRRPHPGAASRHPQADVTDPRELLATPTLARGRPRPPRAAGRGPPGRRRSGVERLPDRTPPAQRHLA